MLSHQRIVNHDELSSLMKSFGYGYYNDRGVCYGFSCMALQAHLTEKTDAFIRRLQSIASLIDETEYFAAEHDYDLIAVRLKIKYKFLARQFIQSDKYQLSLFKPKPPEELQDLIDLFAFLDGIELYSSLRLHPDLFGKNETPKDQCALSTAPFFLSEKIEEMGGLIELNSFSGIYNLDNILNYLNLLNRTIKQHVNADDKDAVLSPLSFTLLSANHAVCLGFNIRQNKWFYSDVNSKPTYFDIEDTANLAEAILQGFGMGQPYDHSSLVVFNTVCYATKQEGNMIQPVISEWIQQLNTDVIKVTEDRAKLQDSFNGATWLYLSAKYGQVDIVKLLIKANVDPNIPLYAGITPLHAAAHNGHTDIVEALIKAGSDVNAVSKTGVTPLHIAILFGDKEIFKILSMEKIDYNFRLKTTKTALQKDSDAHDERTKQCIAKFLDEQPNEQLALTSYDLAKAMGQDEMAQLIARNTETFLPEPAPGRGGHGF